MKRVGLKSGKVIECEDLSFTETAYMTCDLIHTFISLIKRKKYKIKDEDIEFIESHLSDEDISELIKYDECDEPSSFDPSYC
jgi:hypothetical protein